MQIMSRRPPAGVRRQLRQEANFGCVVCGKPIIQYHHIIPFSEERHHDPDRMVVLCPNHHEHAGPNSEALTREDLFQHKESPENSSKVEYPFHFSSGEPALNFAGNRCVLRENRHMTILEIDGNSLLEFSVEGGAMLFSGTIYNKAGELVAEISENEWLAHTDSAWDIEYRANHLKIWHEPQNIGVEVRYSSEDDGVFIRGQFYKNGSLIEGTPNKIDLPNSIGVVKDCVFKDVKKAIVYEYNSDIGGYCLTIG